MDWFEALTGFKEKGYANTKKRLSVKEGRLHSSANGQSWSIGRLEIPTLAELRSQVAKPESAKDLIEVRAIQADVKGLHADPKNCGAVFQVASQFNLLEMTHHSVTPEKGVTRYEHDPTQGPACATMAGAATIYRNYFAPVADQEGQARQHQINTLRDIQLELGQGLIEMRNGYAMSTNEHLEKINAYLKNLSPNNINTLRDKLRIGVHWDVEVTASNPSQLVTQVFCSAIPVSYNQNTSNDNWKPLACLVLEAAYEATLWSAVINAARGQSNKIYLTWLGGGVFGNPREWIELAVERALTLAAKHDISVFLVSHGTTPQHLIDLAHRCNKAR